MNDKSIITIISVALCSFSVSAAVVACYGCQQFEETRREAIKAGLIQQLPPGSSGKLLWARPEEKQTNQ
jgi:hypothetical protein